ncbi:hypothetical protein GGQ86_000817 [Xanthobacter flavus]|uniref:Toprim domain-containing protein n=1 Tax=Xanthobacter flavus TaxID=281 RepID=A0A9W6CGR0_XANFL|nr:toprim domain-containing protein [Xanthobacter flavus]MDR6332370.1 hypothetical protein [Xanthobacter flavus]GLI21881.1 hypothetical protein XFLAVUS301_15550 [Xanthobacter flavus]
MREDDSDHIAGELTKRIEQVLDTYAPGWIEHRGKAYLTSKGPKNLGSFQVNLQGQHRGQFYRFSQQIGGGPVKLLAYLLNGTVGEPSREDFRRAFEEARAFLGIRGQVDHQAAARARRLSEERRAEAVRKEEQRRARRADTAGEMWAQCVPIAGTLAERYLHGRGIPTPPMGWPDVLGFHAGLEYELEAQWQDGRKVRDGRVLPCLVARVQDMAGDTIAVWRIFLNPETAGKAPVENPKVGFGPARGGAVRIGGLAEMIGGGEGLETALAAWSLEGYRHPVWAMLSTSGMMTFEPPIEVQRLRLYPDGDLPRRLDDGSIGTAPGIAAAWKLRDRLAPAGIPTVINPPPFNSDFLDVWNAVRGAA